MSRWVVLVSLTFTMGCAMQVTADDLAARTQADLLAVTRDLAGKTVVVHGRVRSSTLVSRVPAVFLEPGSVQCFFEPVNVFDATDLKPGQEVAFKCVVGSFRPGAVAVLNGCRRVQ